MLSVSLPLIVIILFTNIVNSRPYDPTDTEIKKIIPEDGVFEAFYPRELHGIPNSASRPPHGHGSFFKHRNAALVDVKNAG